jgi:CRISPR-associated endonuclease/helicase Cas3
MMPPKNKPQKAVIIPLKLEECVAKTYKQACGTTIKGRTVLDHCQIVGKVAQEILARIPLELRTKLFPIGTELIASLHDIGKVSPTFQEKIRRAIYGYSANSLEELRDAKPNTESEWGGHTGVLFATLKNMSVKKFIPEIVGMHHGYSTNHNYTATCVKFGGDNWENNRQQLVKELVKYFNCEYPILNQYQARVVAGLTSVSD